MKRTFEQLRELILAELSHGNRTINQLSGNTGINWRTVESHLDFLATNGIVTELVSSEYVRIFGLTKQGISKLGINPKSSSKESREVNIEEKSEVRRIEIR